MPQPDELLSSWLIRVAIKHLTMPSTFMSMHFPEIKQSFWSHDVDVFWGQNQQFLEKLSYKAGLPVNKLQGLTLQSYEGYLAEKIVSNSRNKLLTAVVNRGRSHQNKGLRYCPECLSQDKAPYFRKSWRLSFVTTCIDHKCFLHDCCPKCGMPITLYIVKQEDEFCKCHHCGHHLTDANLIFPNKESYGVAAQIRLMNIYQDGWFGFEERSYYSLAYFPALNQICKLIYNYGVNGGVKIGSIESC